MARIPLGQNTPLTMIGGATLESGVSQTRDGLTTSAAGATYVTGGSQHLRDGSGGTYALRLSTSEEVVFPFGGLSPREVVVAFPLFGERNTALNLIRSGTEFQGGFDLVANMAGRLFRGSATGTPTILATGTTGYFPAGQYSWCNLHYFVDNVSGFADLRVHTYPNLPLSFSGDTQGSATLDDCDALRVVSTGVNSDLRIDDVFVFARTLYYTGGAGAIPVVGQTITDGVTGATCVVDFVEGTNVAGVLVVHTVSSGASFGVTNAINNGVGWTAVASNSLGNDKASLWVPEIFGLPSSVSSDVLTGWTGTTGVNHFSQVADWVGTVDYVFTDTAAQVDQYGTTPPAIAVGTPIYGVIMSLWAANNGSLSVSQAALGYNDGVGNNDGPDQVLPSNYGRVDTFWSYNARTGAAFTLTEINALAARLTSVT